ncbi:hypothetical protein EIM50_15745 [Pseudoxanthomonas sp. SGD-10]|nr:hypothetical protein EIM50_15745 [Pseudoxanthomonas sp. SGD-10]
MKKFYLIFALFLSACIGQKEINCDDLICTQEFRSITVKFVDAEGTPIEVEDFKAINARTKKQVNDGNQGGSLPMKGVYVITSDASLNEFTTNGDIVVVSAKHAMSGVMKTAEYKITGGRCSCHVSKVSGPDEIVFD